MRPKLPHYCLFVDGLVPNWAMPLADTVLAEHLVALSSNFSVFHWFSIIWLDWVTSSEIHFRCGRRYAFRVRGYKPFLWFIACFTTRGLWRQKQVSQAGISNCIPQYSVDAITYLCLRYLILAPKSWNVFLCTALLTETDDTMGCDHVRIVHVMSVLSICFIPTAVMKFCNSCLAHAFLTDPVIRPCQ